MSFQLERKDGTEICSFSTNQLINSGLRQYNSVQVTCSCPRWEDITVNRFDSYGDGWSIGYLQILEDEAQTARDACSETA